MRSDELDLQRYETDKIRNGYLRWYDSLFSEQFASVSAVLELGVYRGGSLELWRDYFPHATVAGVDSDLSHVSCSDFSRIRIFQASQTDTGLLHSIAGQVAPRGFDLIVDDASHIASETEASFGCLFDDHLKPGGVYVIEDWGTGYMDDWPDGRSARRDSRLRTLLSRLARRSGMILPVRSHAFGMVGFIKKLIDEQGMENLSKANRGARPERLSRFSEMIITPGLVAVRKVR